MMTLDGHIRMNDSRLPEAVFYGELAKGKRLRGGPTAAKQRCSETTPDGYTHHRRPLGDSCTRSTTVEAAIHTGKGHTEENISQKYQHDHNLRHGFPDASASIIFCVNCGRGFKSQIGLFSHQRAKHVTDETLH